MKAKTDFVLEHAGWAALLVDDTCTIRSANGAAAATFGSVVEGESPLLSSLWSPENETTAEQFLVRLERTKQMPITLRLRVKGGVTAKFNAFICLLTRDGQKFFLFQLFGEPPVITGGSAATAASDSPASSVEAGVAQKQKLDCALQLIRTVVLDFNNTLTSILGHTSLMLDKIDARNPWRNSLLEVEKSAQKAAEIAHELAAFSRQEKDTHSLLAGNLNDLLQRTVDLMPVPTSLKVHWNLELEKRLYTVQFDEAKMQQAFLKVLDNALQAVGPDARITVRTRNLECTEPLRDGTVSVAPGDYVVVEIADNGCGISPDILPRIFEPFFTTKANHRGLGLAWVYGIVTNHGGTVAVSSAPHQGTAVRLYLRALKRFVKGRSIPVEDLSGTQTILIVDDEALMLTMGQMVLSAYGYRVLTAESGEKALEIMAGDIPVDLVITDLVMPGMSGRELMERLRNQSTHVKVLCCSGYIRPANALEEEVYLQKPFTSQQLLRKVKQLVAQLDLT